MRTLFDAATEPTARLLVMLPAAKALPEQFMEHGFVAALRARQLALDVLLVDAHSDYYLEGDIVERLDAEVVRPMAAKGYRELWLAGISLGGMGCIAYACQSATPLAGMLLLAPFLGVRGADREPEMLTAFSRGQAGARRLPSVFLGYGAQDRYAHSSARLACLLPPERTVTIDGGHDWPTWRALWPLMLAQAFER